LPLLPERRLRRRRRPGRADRRLLRGTARGAEPPGRHQRGRDPELYRRAPDRPPVRPGQRRDRRAGPDQRPRLVRRPLHPAAPSPLPSYATALNVSSATALAPESPAAGIPLAATRAPVLIAQTATTYRFRYFFTAATVTAPVLKFIGGSLNFTDASGATIPLF